MYNETVQDGFNGMRCHTFKDPNAAEWALGLDDKELQKIRTNDCKKWGMKTLRCNTMNTLKSLWTYTKMDGTRNNFANRNIKNLTNLYPKSY